ncbi:hypothetical protein EST38_g12410 [Candolleomyces aberdarensis]|uniref:Uncharacterized protein n=1 Tax=Candolleomyces aberdarensis TaxID=2316362 RepID=A0A4Q2D526_9AGAR|nr:hypothetical protein EST38_g12410 [Candolleomyces aberdarensis]
MQAEHKESSSIEKVRQASRKSSKKYYYNHLEKARQDSRVRSQKYRERIKALKKVPPTTIQSLPTVVSSNCSLGPVNWEVTSAPSTPATSLLPPRTRKSEYARCGKQSISPNSRWYWPPLPEPDVIPDPDPKRREREWDTLWEEFDRAYNEGEEEEAVANMLVVP